VILQWITSRERKAAMEYMETDLSKKKRRTLTSKVIIFCSQGGAKRKIVNFQNYFFG